MPKVIAVSCDIECSHLYDKIAGDLLSLALVEIMDDYTLGRKLSLLSAPESPMYFNDESARVHGFSYFKATSFPSRRECIEDTMAWLEPLNGLNLPFLYYANALFDYRWLEAHFLKELHQAFLYKAFQPDQCVSVLKMARENFKNADESKKINPLTGKPFTRFSLRNICDHLDIDLDHHEALSDAVGCARIWISIKKGLRVWTGRFL